MMKIRTFCILFASIAWVCIVQADTAGTPPTQATLDDGTWHVLNEDQLPAASQHTEHLDRYGNAIEGHNRLVLEAIDKVQSTAMDGGGYFIGITADPPESPIGYGLTLFGQPLLNPPRTSSYCSGATYTAFIETLNLKHDADTAILQENPGHTPLPTLSSERVEAMRMQEPDGGRREDGIKFWGHWNDDGFGTQFALVQYSGMGEEIKPNRARPGDFMNISWTNGGGHSVIFLGWHQNDDGKHLLYWSSQKSTHGMGDQLVLLSRIRKVKIVRLTDPDRLFNINVDTAVDRKVPGDTIDW
jgi:hypothetical protein